MKIQYMRQLGRSQGKTQAGFTLIELLLYVSLVGSLLTAVVMFFAMTLDARVKTQRIS